MTQQHSRTGASGRRRLRIWSLLAAFALIVLAPSTAYASHPEASLAGSNFEIDTNANLKVDDPAPPSLDWANVAEIRATDKVNGTGDDSYAGGVKEDTVCPGSDDRLHPAQQERPVELPRLPGGRNRHTSRVLEPGLEPGLRT